MSAVFLIHEGISCNLSLRRNTVLRNQTDVHVRVLTKSTSSSSKRVRRKGRSQRSTPSSRQIVVTASVKRLQSKFEISSDPCSLVDQKSERALEIERERVESYLESCIKKWNVCRFKHTMIGLFYCIARSFMARELECSTSHFTKQAHSQFSATVQPVFMDPGLVLRSSCLKEELCLLDDLFASVMDRLAAVHGDKPLSRLRRLRGRHRAATHPYCLRPAIFLETDFVFVSAHQRCKRCWMN